MADSRQILTTAVEKEMVKMRVNLATRLALIRVPNVRFELFAKEASVYPNDNKNDGRPILDPIWLMIYSQLDIKSLACAMMLVSKKFRNLANALSIRQRLFQDHEHIKIQKSRKAKQDAEKKSLNELEFLALPSACKASSLISSLDLKHQPTLPNNDFKFFDVGLNANRNPPELHQPGPYLLCHK